VLRLRIPRRGGYINRRHAARGMPEDAMTFMDKLRGAWRKRNSLLCVGLDPDVRRMPHALRAAPRPLFAFNRAIIDATADCVCAYKPQVAYYAARGAEGELEQTLAYLRDRHPDIPVILDAKRGDIGATAEQYAAEAFDRYGADAVTVNPYLGGDALAPFLDRADRGVFILCRTSNPGGRDLQECLVDGRPLYQVVAERAAREWNRHGNAGLVVGATCPDELAAARGIAETMPFLVPGVGAQGGDAGRAVTAGKTSDGTGLLVNVSRGVLYASSGTDFAEAARSAAVLFRETLNADR
jgi:orotidine-5'-phosphate decarboxylase